MYFTSKRQYLFYTCFSGCKSNISRYFEKGIVKLWLIRLYFPFSFSNYKKLWIKDSFYGDDCVCTCVCVLLRLDILTQ